MRGQARPDFGASLGFVFHDFVQATVWLLGVSLRDGVIQRIEQYLNAVLLCW